MDCFNSTLALGLLFVEYCASCQSDKFSRHAKTRIIVGLFGPLTTASYCLAPTEKKYPGLTGNG